MSETQRDYTIGYGKPPPGRRFEKGRSGNPRGPRGKSLPALLVAALNEPVFVTTDGRRHRTTNRSAEADLRATKMLLDMLKDIEQTAAAAPPPERSLTAPDKEVVAQFVARLRRQIAAEAADRPQ